ncbi:MAG: alpha-L-fucosidase [Clostridia bacterium]|nr:alpha-L-fucosidase [Clostridia bacterium]
MDNKFGLFIHWGIYSLTGIQEQAFARADWDREKYEALAEQFNPANYHPEEWVIMAKNAGMEYICFTTKHHDGYCMWDTKYTNYKVKRDLLRELADACHKHEVKLSLYYSNPDWHHPHAYNPHSTHQWKAIRNPQGDFALYKQYVKDQITELLTGYGPIYTLFWDVPPGITDPTLNDYARSLQPGILINNRGFDQGDFSTPERELAANRDPYPQMTEACNSLDPQSWGYRTEPDYYSTRFLLSSIAKTMAKGGSFLLNVGPDPDGVIPPESRDRLEIIGNWYNRTEGSLANHTPDLFDYGRVTGGEYIAVRKGNKSYFHFYDGLNATAILLERWPGLPKSVRLLNSGESLPFGIGCQVGYINGTTGRMEQEFLWIRKIPTDHYAAEPITIEIIW